MNLSAPATVRDSAPGPDGLSAPRTGGTSAWPDGFRPKPRRVLMTADTVGGVWTFALELARELGRQGIETALVTMGRSLSREQRQAAASLPRLDVFESAFKLEWMPDPWDDLQRAGDWLLELEQQLHPDLVHLNGYCHGSLPWAAPRLVVGHSCVLSWWRAVHGHPAPADWNRYRDAVAAGLRQAGLVLAPSAAMLRELDELYGPFQGSGVITNGRRRLCAGSGPKEKFILSAGRLWDEAKNISVLASLAAELSWPVCLAGEQKGPTGTPLACPHARLLGQLDEAELAGWMRRASIYVLPAKYEPFGLSILEAAQAGCALVLGDIPSLRELWDGAAVFVPPSNPEELKDALDELIWHPAWLAEMSARALRRAARYSPELMADGYLEAYARLLELRPPVCARPAPQASAVPLNRALPQHVVA